MEQGESSRKGKHLTREERVVIERMSRGGRPPRDIAEVLGRTRRTIERELVRGRVEHKDGELRVNLVYSSDRGQDVHDLNATAKGPELKLGTNYKLADYIGHRYGPLSREQLENLLHLDVFENVVQVLAPAVSVAVTRTLIAPTSALRGVPVKLRVAPSKASQSGSARPSDSVAP